MLGIGDLGKSTSCFVVRKGDVLKTKKRDNLSTLSRLVPEVGIEPTLLAEHEFESCASTNSATPAFVNSIMLLALRAINMRL